MNKNNIVLNAVDDVYLLRACFTVIQSSANSGENDNESIALLIDVILYYIDNKMSYLNGGNENE